jgi:hypothetical protein
MADSYFARLAWRESARMLEFRARIAAATSAAPVPPTLLLALTQKVDTAFTHTVVPHPSGSPGFIVVEIDLADWLAAAIDAQWPGAAVQAAAQGA